MPTEAENVQYLYLVLTYDGTPTIDWDPICAALDLSKGAVTKRWSRLKQSMDKGESPGGSTYSFLWLCVKHLKRDKAPNWAEIAKKCNTTTGAASKRYSRMKKAFEENDTAPGASPSPPATKSTPAKIKTPRAKNNVSSGDDAEDIQATPTPKRKRATPKKKVIDEDEQKFKPEPLEDEDELLNTKAKRAKATPQPKTKANGAIKKEIIDADDEDAFFDASEQPEVDIKDLADAAGEQVRNEPTDLSEDCVDCKQCACHAKELANVLMSRSGGLAEADRLELEEMVGIVDMTE